MLTGEPPHRGKSAQQIIMKIVTDTPRPVTELRRTVPPHVAATIAKALEKLPADRFATAADFADALAGRTPIAGYHSPTRNVTAAGARMRSHWRRGAFVAASLGAAGVALTLAWRMGRDRSHEAAAVRFAIPQSYAHSAGLVPSLVFSLDGQTVFFQSNDSVGTPTICARPLGALETRVIPGTANTFLSGLSADGQSLLVLNGADTRVRRVPLAGGPIVDLDAGVDPAMSPDGALVFRRFYSDGLWMIPAAGGPPQELTVRDSVRQEIGHAHPQPLPNGKGILFTAIISPSKSAVEVFDLKNRRRILIAGDGAVGAKYSATGHVLFWRRGLVFAVPFDAEQLRVTGPAVPVLEDVLAEPRNGSASFAVASTGTLVYVRAKEWNRDGRVVWVDRTGGERPAGPRADHITRAALSPDGKTLALAVGEPRSNLWLHDLARGTTTQLTRGDSSAESPVWSKDGRHLYYQRDSPIADIYRVAVDGLSPSELVWHDDNYKWPLDVSPDGETLVDVTFALNRHVLTLRALTKKGTPRILADGQAQYEPDARFSPNGRWVAFSVSPSEGRLYELYVQATAGGPRRQLSIGGGTRPRWTHGGRDLVYVAADSIMTIAVDPETGAAQKPRLLLRDARVQQTLSLEVAPDGDHFLMVLPVDNPKAAPITVVLNWFTELRSLMKAK